MDRRWWNPREWADWLRNLLNADFRSPSKPITRTNLQLQKLEESDLLTYRLAWGFSSGTPGTYDFSTAATTGSLTNSAGVTSFGGLGTYSDVDSANSIFDSGDFYATIRWGDGDISTGTLISESTNVYAVADTHSYTDVGAYRPAVYLVADSGTLYAKINDTIKITEPPPILDTYNGRLKKLDHWLHSWWTKKGFIFWRRCVYQRDEIERKSN